MKRNPLVVTALVAGALALTAGCGSGAGADGANDKESSNAPALTGSPIVIGVISDDSGANGATGDAAATAKGWSDYINGHGGIAGHPVKVIVKDTQSSAANALQAARDLIENDKAIIIGDSTFSNTAFAKYATEAKVPVIGMNTGSATTQYLSDPNFFTATPGVLTILQGLPSAAAQLGATKFSFLYCAEIAACGQAVPLVKGGAEAAGGSMPYSASFSASAPNYTAQCLAARNAGVDVLFAGGSVPSANKRVYDDCAKQGYKPLAAFSVSTISEEVLKDPLIPRLVGVTAVRPWFLTDTPGAKLFNEQMGGYLKKAVSQPVVAADWAAFQLIAKVLAGVTKAPTSQDVYDGLYALKGETLDGLTVPVTFAKGKPTTSNCFFAYKGESGTLSVLNDGKPLCLASAQ